MKYIKGIHLLRIVFLWLLFSLMSRAQAPAGVPVFQVTAPPDSKITFNVKASVAIDGTFDKWDATLTFTSPDVTTGVLDIKAAADSVNTGSGMKDAAPDGEKRRYSGITTMCPAAVIFTSLHPSEITDISVASPLRHCVRVATSMVVVRNELKRQSGRLNRETIWRIT